MPRPLTSLSPDELNLYGKLTCDPLATDTPQILADAAEDQTQHRRSTLLREQARLACLELLRGGALTDRESAVVADRIRALLKNPAAVQPAGVERELSAALGSPLRGDAMLQLLDADGALDAQRLREQYDFQVTLLASLDLLTEQNGQPGITGIDHHFHPLPALTDIQARLETSAMRRKVEQGFNQLLLVPFALPLQRLIEAWKRDLLRNDQLLHAHGGLNREQPAWVWERLGRRDGRGPDEDGRLVYFPRRFDSDHGGQTKAELLAADPTAAWQVLLTEGSLTNLPRAGQGQIIAGRPQIEAGRTPQQYLADWPDGEAGWTPETYIAGFLSALERGGAVLDTQMATLLTASYLPADGCTPYACWYLRYRQACLGGLHPDFDDPYDGSRAAVRVVRQSILGKPILRPRVRPLARGGEKAASDVLRQQETLLPVLGSDT